MTLFFFLRKTKLCLVYDNISSEGQPLLYIISLHTLLLLVCLLFSYSLYHSLSNLTNPGLLYSLGFFSQSVYVCAHVHFKLVRDSVHMLLIRVGQGSSTTAFESNRISILWYRFTIFSLKISGSDMCLNFWILRR